MLYNSSFTLAGDTVTVKEIREVAEGKDASITTASQPGRSLPSILCIDDDPEIAKIWRIRLARLGVDVASAVDGEAGFAAALQQHPDLILLDVCMPGGDGNCVLSRLRSHPQTRRIPVLVLTGGDAATARRLTSQHGADDYLTKPLNFAALLEKLRRYLPIS